MISVKNRKSIFHLCNSLGIDDETRHTLQFSACGKESMKDMDDIDATKVIHVLLRERKKKSVKTGKWKNHLKHGDNIHNLMTPDQLNKIKAMSAQIYGKYDESKINNFCMRQFKKPLKKLTSDDSRKLIEIQKSILKRKLRGTA